MLRAARNCKQKSSLRKILAAQPQKSPRNTCKSYFVSQVKFSLRYF
ncbi:hypothetical protein CAMSH0001_1597 [Campylobacter showae RM3277]|uniref:Uncharacterized protein n=1 Tax=Campylobacter showae RM3277 TaxID=553219 RepID=C6RGP4_9BACT|nr:hypothetical protein CAMSH0001_1597 [Campylobacter showae RM3277]